MENATVTLPETAPQTPRTPMTPVQILDLRRRVLAGDAVSDEELRAALEDLARMRGTAPASSSDAALASLPTINVGSSFAEFMAKKKAAQV